MHKIDTRKKNAQKNAEKNNNPHYINTQQNIIWQNNIWHNVNQQNDIQQNAIVRKFQ